MRNRKTVICTKHKNIISYCDICLESKKELNEDVVMLLNKIKEVVQEANEDAKAMEERLYKYKLAIEKLGFKRVK
jgi:uncharacterized protein YlxW (UPF0749 family)